MAKITYAGSRFDSELEVDYYKWLVNNPEVVEFIYHPSPINLNAKNKYTPDFLVRYVDKAEIIETKGFNQYSYRSDNLIHNLMLEKTEEELRQYLEENEFYCEHVIYRKIKYLKDYGWVDFDFKKPNTMLNQKRTKIKELEAEIKELKAFKKDVLRYFSYQGKKLTKQQQQWKDKFEKEYKI